MTTTTTTTTTTTAKGTERTGEWAGGNACGRDVPTVRHEWSVYIHAAEAPP